MSVAALSFTKVGYILRVVLKCSVVMNGCVTKSLCESRNHRSRRCFHVGSPAYRATYGDSVGSG